MQTVDIRWEVKKCLELSSPEAKKKMKFKANVLELAEIEDLTLANTDFLDIFLSLP